MTAGDLENEVKVTEAYWSLEVNHRNLKLKFEANRGVHAFNTIIVLNESVSCPESHISNLGQTDTWWLSPDLNRGVHLNTILRVSLMSLVTQSQGNSG